MMTTCDTIRNRLLAETNPARVPADLRPHLAECGACRDFLERYELLAADIAALPAPASELAKITLLESLSRGSGVVRPQPSARSLRRVLGPLAATAAAIAAGVGLWSVWPRAEAPVEMAAPRHQLLQRVVAAHTGLATAAGPKQRIGMLAALAGDLGGEARDLMHAATESDLNLLAGLYEDVVARGLVSQARQMNPLAEAAPVRIGVLTDAADRLATDAAEAANLARTAPPQARAAMQRIARAAADGHSQLIRIARGEGA